MALVKAALLDADDVFVCIDEVDESQLTARHLPSILQCDLPAGQYRWIPDAGNPYGGAFWSVQWLARQQRS